MHEEELKAVIKNRAILYAARKCGCATCPVGHDDVDREYQEFTCDRFNRYVKIYSEIAEPYEKRIAELESANMSLRETIDCMS